MVTQFKLGLIYRLVDEQGLLNTPFYQSEALEIIDGGGLIIPVSFNDSGYVSKYRLLATGRLIHGCLEPFVGKFFQLYVEGEPMAAYAPDPQPELSPSVPFDNIIRFPRKESYDYSFIKVHDHEPVPVKPVKPSYAFSVDGGNSWMPLRPASVQALAA